MNSRLAGFSENHPAEHVRQLRRGEHGLGHDLEGSQPGSILVGRTMDDHQLVAGREGRGIQSQQEKVVGVGSEDRGGSGADDAHNGKNVADSKVSDKNKVWVRQGSTTCPVPTLFGIPG